MKRIIATLLLLIMVFGAHPVFAMHFCGDSLYSVNILNYGTPKECCQVEWNVPQPQNHSNCHEDETLPTTEVDHHQSSVQGECCDTQKVQITTDDYTDRQYDASSVVPPSEIVWFVLSYASINVEIDDITSLQKTFPPRGLYIQNIDLLAQLCTYLI